MLKRITIDGFFNANIRFMYIRKGTKGKKVTETFQLSRLKLIKETTTLDDGRIQTIYALEAPSLNAGEAEILKDDQDLAKFQEWFVKYDIGLASYNNPPGDTPDDGIQCDTFFFAIIRNGAHFRDGKSTLLIDVLAGMNKNGRQYPKTEVVDGAGDTIYQISERAGDEGSTSCLKRVFPPPKEGGGCCVLL